MAAISTHSFLSDDLIIEILLRLPVKSLLRFRTVCKKWLVIIKNPSFIRRHVYHESNRTRLLVYYHAFLSTNPVSEFYDFTLFQDETLETYEEPDNLKLPGPIEALRGPCNGIFCVLSTSLKLALWNPATRRMRQLPSPSEDFLYIDEIGLGIDPLTDELKIVLILGECCVWSHLDPCYAVYTSSNDSWKYYEDEVLLDNYSCVSQTQCGTTFLNGFYYWYKYKMKTRSSVILAFDMHNEVFQEIEMPEIVRSRQDGELGLYNDSLALFSHDINAFDNRIDIWVMNEKGCWTELLTCVLPFRLLYPLGFWESKQLFVTTGANKIEKLILYDTYSHNTRNIRAEKREIACTRKVWPFYFKESLVSVETNGILDHDIQSEVISKFLIRRWPGHEFDPE